MSMYECAFCGGEWGNYPEVIMYINKFGNSRGESKLQDLFRKVAKKFNYNTYTTNVELQTNVFKEFDYHVMNNTLWFCTKKCAQFYLTHELPEWELDKLGE